MKKLITFIVAAVAIAIAGGDAKAEIFQKIIENCGPDGCSKVEQTANKPLIGQNVHTLFCKDTGAVPCRWDPLMFNLHPPLLGGVGENSIRDGNYHGTYSATVNGVPCTVTWDATDPYNYSIVEHDEDGPLN